MQQTTHYLLLNDQPTTCPQCGARSDFSIPSDKPYYYEKHQCLAPQCNHIFLATTNEEFVP